MAAARVLSKRLTPLLCRSSASLLAGHASSSVTCAGAAEVGIRALHDVSTGAIRPNTAIPNNQGLHAFAARTGMTLMKNNPMKPPFLDSINGAKRPFSSRSTKNDDPFGSSESSFCSYIFLFTTMTFFWSAHTVRKRQRGD